MNNVCPKHVMCSCVKSSRISELENLLYEAEAALKKVRSHYSGDTNDKDWAHETISMVSLALSNILKFKAK